MDSGQLILPKRKSKRKKAKGKKIILKLLNQIPESSEDCRIEILEFFRMDSGGSDGSGGFENNKAGSREVND